MLKEWKKKDLNCGNGEKFKARKDKMKVLFMYWWLTNERKKVLVKRYNNLVQLDNQRGFVMLGTNHSFNNIWRKSNWLLWWVNLTFVG
jgi:hypothetical protein